MEFCVCAICSARESHQDQLIIVLIAYFQVIILHRVYTREECGTQTLVGSQTVPFPRTDKKVLLCISVQTRQRGSRTGPVYSLGSVI